MTEDNHSNKTVNLREILVAVDASSHSQAALEAAAVLAKAFEANIRGLFVQDEIWRRVTELSSTTAVTALTGQIFILERKTMEQQVSVLKSRLRQKLEYLSKRNRISHTWHSASGKVEEEILEAADEADLITIGQKGLSAMGKRLGSSAKAIIEKTNKPVLILKEGLQLGATLTAVYDGSEESQKGIRLALDIVEKRDSALTVLAINNNNEKAQEERNKKLERLLENSPAFVEIELLDHPNVARFLNSVNLQKPGLLIIPKDQPLLARSLQIILNHIKCPLLIVC